MANFCTKCGTPLVNGRCPKCDREPETKQVFTGDSQGAAEETWSGGTTDRGAQAKDAAQNYLQAVLNIIRRPVNGFRESVADKNSKVGLIMMGLEALTSGLCVFFLIDKMVSAATAGLSSFGSYGSVVSSQLPSAGGYFIREIIFSIVLSLILSLLVWGLLKGMRRADINWFQSCQVAGVKSLGCFMGWLIAALGVITGLYVVAILALVLGMALGNIYFVAAMLNYPKVRKDGTTYAIFLLVIILAIIYFFIFTQLMTSAVGEGLRSMENLP